MAQNSDFIVKNGLVVKTTATIGSLIDSTSTNTGALTVQGGVGINKDLFVGGKIYANGWQLSTDTSVAVSAGTSTWASTATNINGGTTGSIVYQTAPGQTGFIGIGSPGYVLLSNGTTATWVSTATLGVGGGGTNSVIAGTDTSVSTQSGIVTVWNTSTLQSVTQRGGSTNQLISITNATPTTSGLSGALTVAGGVGVGGGVFVSGSVTATNITVNGTTPATSTTTGALTVAGGVGIQGDLWVGGTGRVDGAIIVTTATFSESLGSALATVTYLADYITNDPTVETGLSTIAGTSVAYGVYTTGTVASVRTFGDYNTSTGVGYYAINDQAGIAPAYVAYIGFSNVTKFNRIVLNINYTQSSGHTIDIDLYNYHTGAWDTFGLYSGSAGWQQFAFGLVDDVPYINTGSVTTSTVNMRIYHVNSGNSNHRTWLDYVALEQSTSGGQGPRGATGATGSTGLQGISTSTTSTFDFFDTTDSINSTTGAVRVAGGVGIRKNLHVGGDLHVFGNTVFDQSVTFNGTATYVLSTNTVYTDSLIELHKAQTGTWTFDDGNDIGIVGNWYDTDAAMAKKFFFGFAPDTQSLEFYKDGIEVTPGHFSGTYGDLQLNKIVLVSTETSVSALTGALVVPGGVGIQGDLNIQSTGKLTVGIEIAAQVLPDVPAQFSGNVNSYFQINSQNINSDAYASTDLVLTADNGTDANNYVNVGVAGSQYSYPEFNIYQPNDGYLTAKGNNLVIATGNPGKTIEFYTDGASTTNSNHIATMNTVGLVVQTTATSNSAGSGALQVVGGVGIAKDLYVGGAVTVVGTLNATINGVASTATNVGGGNTGDLLYQSSTGNTNFITIGAAGTILTSNGTTATWQSTASLYASYANTATFATSATFATTSSFANSAVTAVTANSAVTATNLNNGALGSIPYQTSAGHTSFIDIGVNGTVLTSNGTTATWANAGGIAVGYATTATYATTSNYATTATYAVSAGTADYATTATTSSYATAANYAISAGYATSASIATTATNLNGGLAGSIPYQTAPGITAYIDIGVNGTILVSNGTTATWTTAGSIAAGSADFANTASYATTATYASTASYATTATYASTASYSSTSTNLDGGLLGSIPYQTAPGITSFIGIGATGTVLLSNGTTASWVSTSSLGISGGGGGASDISSTGTTNTFTISNLTPSTSTQTGALVVFGGVGVGQDLNVGGRIDGGGVRTTTSPTPPTGMTVGDFWYNTTSDVMYRYTYDGASYYWIDIYSSVTPDTISPFLLIGA